MVGRASATLQCTARGAACNHSATCDLHIDATFCHGRLCAMVQATSVLDKPSSPLAKCVAIFVPAFCSGPANLGACCSKPGKGDGYRWSKESSAWRQKPALRWPCLVKGWEQCACPRCQLPHTGFCRYTPENWQIRAAGWVLTLHSRLPSPRRQLPASYAPLLRTSATISRL